MPEIVIAPNGRRFARNAWSASLHKRNRWQYTAASAVVRPTEYPYPTVTGTSRRALKVTATFAPTAWRVYALNSERRSANTAKLAVWRGDKNAGWANVPPALSLAASEAEPAPRMRRNLCFELATCG